MFAWLYSNLPVLLSIVAMLLAVGIGFANLFHASGVANALSDIQAIIQKLQGGQLTNTQSLLELKQKVDVAAMKLDIAIAPEQPAPTSKAKR